jgi:hypothetical protein
MKARAPFASPDAVPFRVGSSLSRGEVIDRLEGALGDYFKTESGSPRYFGLSGRAAGGSVALTVRPYLAPGEKQFRGMMPIELRGEVVSIDGGSEIRGTATSPIGRTLPTYLAVGWTAVVLVGILDGPFLGVFALTAGGAAAVAWALVIRHNQRTALGKVDEVARVILERILSD